MRKPRIEYDIKYLDNHKERRKQSCRDYYLSHKKEHAERVRRNYLEKRFVRLRKTMIRGIRMKLQLCIILGGVRCVRCGFTDIRALNFDHINNDGNKERLVAKAFLRYYIDHPIEAKQKLQVLCANCNWVKEITRRYRTKQK